MRREAIERLLPAVYQRAAGPGSVLGALLDVMETLHAPDEALLAHIDDLFAGYRTPDSFVRLLAAWVALDRSTMDVPVGRLRDLVAHGAPLARRRGTAEGLISILTIALGVTGVTVDEPAERAFHFVVRIPAEAADRADLVRRIVEAQKPAATTYDVHITTAAKEPGP